MYMKKHWPTGEKIVRKKQSSKQGQSLLPSGSPLKFRNGPVYDTQAGDWPDYPDRNSDPSESNPAVLRDYVVWPWKACIGSSLGK